MNQKDVKWVQDTLQKMKSDLSWMSHEIWKIENILAEQTSAGGLTTDAPEMTVGDSSSVSEHFTHEPCPDCNGSGINTDRWAICRNCNGEGMVLSAKPKNRTPSPTPSFR